MKSNQIFRILRWIGTIAAFTLLIYLLSQQGWGRILEGARQIPPWRFAVAAGLMILSRLAVATRWHLLLRFAGIPIPFLQSLRITFAGLFSSNFLPTTVGGDFVRLAMLMRTPYDKAATGASLIVDRLVGMAGMASATIFGFGTLSSLFAATIKAPAFAAALPFHKKTLAKGRALAQNIWQALLIWAKSPWGLAAGFGITWIHQLCIFGINWVILTGMGEDISFWLVAGLWSFTYFVTLLPISINGLGLQSLSMTALFTGFGGVSIEAAAISALLVRTLQILISLPGAVFLPDILKEVKTSGQRKKAVE